jgi:uncharacterized protein (TIGR00251 family)
MIPPCLHPHDAGVILSLRVTPRAAQSGIRGMQGEELKVSLHAAPADGQANQELLRLLAKFFSLPKRAVELLSGETSRSKRVLLHGVTAAEIGKRLEEKL